MLKTAADKPFVAVRKSQRNIRFYIFLKDVLLLAFTSFGGPQVHIALFIRRFVNFRKYLTEAELLELYALCQVLPGPTSTQTITAIGFRMGGPRLAFLTLLVWILPSTIIMTAAALGIQYFTVHHLSLAFTKFMLPIAVAFVAHSAYSIGTKVIQNYVDIILMVISAVVTYFLRSPWISPLVLLGGGLYTAIRFRKLQPKEPKEPIHIEWANFILYMGILVGAAVLGQITHWLPVRLFENFYRNGSLIFGGGQVLTPLLYTEFVQFKHYLTSQEFLSGYAFNQALPGPVFAFCGFVGALSMRSYGIGGQLAGSLMATVGIFLPGTLLIFFIIRFWSQLKKYRVVKASLEGINAASAGLVAAAALMLFHPISPTIINLFAIVATFVSLQFTRLPAYVIIIVGLALGFIF